MRICSSEPGPAAASLPAPKNFFAKTSFTHRLPPLWDRTIFGQVFVRGGMTKFSKWKVPPTGGSADKCTAAKQVSGDAPRHTRRDRLLLARHADRDRPDRRAGISLRAQRQNHGA